MDKVFLSFDFYGAGNIGDDLMLEGFLNCFENQEIELNIFIEEIKQDKKDIIIEAFENALKDICKGLLPLGGMTTKGHGIFIGKLFINEELKFDYEANK